MKKVLLVAPLYHQVTSYYLNSPTLRTFKGYFRSRGLPLWTLSCMEMALRAIDREIQEPRVSKALARAYHRLDRSSALDGPDLKLYLSIAGYFFPQIESDVLSDVLDIGLRASFALRMHLHQLRWMEDFSTYRGETDLEKHRDELFHNLYLHAILPRVRRLRPDVIGCSCTVTEQVNSAILLAEMLRRYYGKIPVILGGPAVTMIPEEEKEMVLRDHPAITCLASFDGCELIESAIHGRFPERWERVPNLTMRVGDGIRRTPQHPVVSKMLRAVTTSPGRWRDPQYRIHASQGCGWAQCVFCELPFLECTRRRFMCFKDPRCLVKEIRQIRRSAPGAALQLNTAGLTPAYIRRVDRSLRGTKAGAAFSTFIRCDAGGDEDALRLLGTWGDVTVTFGAESFAKKTLVAMRKGYTKETAIRAIRNASLAGLTVFVNVITGFPGETLQDVKETQEALKEVCRYVDGVRFSSFKLSICSPMFRNLDRYPLRPLPAERRLLSPRMPFVFTGAAKREERDIARCWRRIGRMCRRLVHRRIASEKADTAKPEDVRLSLYGGTTFSRVRYHYRFSEIRPSRRGKYRPRPGVLLVARGKARHIAGDCFPYLRRMEKRGGVEFKEIPPRFRDAFCYLVSEGLLRASASRSSHLR